MVNTSYFNGLDLNYLANAANHQLPAVGIALTMMGGCRYINRQIVNRYRSGACTPWAWLLAGLAATRPFVGVGGSLIHWLHLGLHAVGFLSFGRIVHSAYALWSRLGSRYCLRQSQIAWGSFSPQVDGPFWSCQFRDRGPRIAYAMILIQDQMHEHIFVPFAPRRSDHWSPTQSQSRRHHTNV